MTVKVIGAGLAGCEAAWQLAKAGISVQLYEMKPKKYSPAHHYSGFAELVCSNSLKAARIGSAAGMLKAEMRLFDSLILRCAEESAVAAGGALAVDRTRFSDLVTEAIRQNEHICIFEEEVTEIPKEPVIIATGPLTSEGLSEAIRRYCGTQYLSFFDAAAPIVSAESLNSSRVFMAARYGRGDADYVNCPFTREEYEAFYDALIHAESAPLHEFDRRDFKVYEGCMPIEVMARRGADTLRYGPLKPVGLTDPNTGKRPYAVAQLRRENAAGSMYNLVGFQTNLKFPEQKRVFSMIPGLENAEFYRYGVMHRNTFLNSPKLLNFDFSLRTAPLIAFAGQLTGVEGYIESASSGIMAGYYMAKKLCGEEIAPLPTDCMMGALASYISNPAVEDFQPMGCNMGILPDIGERIRDKALRYTKVAERGINALKSSLAKG